MNENVPKWILIHTSDVLTSVLKDQLSSINKYHQWRGFPKSFTGYYIGYHALVSNGKLYRTREDTEEGSHCNQQDNGVSLNFQSLGICIAGDHDLETVSPQDLALLKKQVQEWQEKYNIPPERVVAHRKFTPWKTCPGTLLTDEWIKGLTIKKDSEQQKKIEEITKKIGLLNRLVELYRELLTIKK